MIRRLIPLALAAALVPAVLSTAAAAPSVVFAVPTGHAPGGPANNQTSTWEEALDLPEGACQKVNDPGGATYLVTAPYGTVIVKAGSDQSALAPNTIFSDVTAGQTVFADSNKTFVFDKGDKAISHVILCAPGLVPTTTPPPTTAPPTTAPPTTSTPTPTAPPTTEVPTSTAPAPTSNAPESSPSITTTPISSLPATGSDTQTAVLLALALIVGGAILYFVTRRGGH
jgi:LPXTG-motif cell wall-anchored protein